MAGEATDKSATSNNKATLSGIEIRSPLIKVKILLSSITEFIDSIHKVSTGPSKTSHLLSPLSSAQTFLITDDKTPSVHSLVARSNSPYNSPKETALGLIGKALTELTLPIPKDFILPMVFIKVCQVTDLPEPEGPTIIVE